MARPTDEATPGMEMVVWYTHCPGEGYASPQEATWETPESTGRCSKGLTWTSLFCGFFHRKKISEAEYAGLRLAILNNFNGLGGLGGSLVVCYLALGCRAEGPWPQCENRGGGGSVALDWQFA